MNAIKILGISTQLSGTGTTVPNLSNLGAEYVLLQHTGSNHNLVIQKSGIGTTVGSINLPGKALLVIKKQRTDTLEVSSGNDVFATSVVYQG